MAALSRVEYEELFKGSGIFSSFPLVTLVDFLRGDGTNPWETSCRSIWNALPCDRGIVSDLVHDKSHFVFPDPSFPFWDGHQFPKCPIDLSPDVKAELGEFGGELPRPTMRVFAVDPFIPNASFGEIGRKLSSYHPHERIASVGSVVTLHLLDLVLGDASPARGLPILTSPTLSLLPGRAGSLPCVVGRKDGRITVSFMDLHPHAGAVLAIPVHRS